MTAKKMRDALLGLLCGMAAAVAATGCIKDDLSGCAETRHLTVRAYARQGDARELGTDEVKDVKLFLFDGDGRFLRGIDTRVGERVGVDIPPGETVRVVAWGNLGQDGQSHTQPGEGDMLGGCLVGLLRDVRSPEHSLPPADLFRGDIVLADPSGAGETALPIYREVGGMAVTVRNLKAFAGFPDDDYRVVVRGTFSGIAFDGRRSGDGASYQPVGAFSPGVNNPDHLTPPFNLIPEEEEESGVTIDIYHGDRLVASVSCDGEGNPIMVEKGRLTNVLVDLRASVLATLSLTDWGNYVAWKEF